jgi:15-cis-phytoene synthase
MTELSEAPPEPGLTPPGLTPPGPPGLGPATLTAAYERCRQLNRRHGTSYYLATRLLPDWKRPHVHALYGFARYADEIVDDLGNGLSPAQRALALADWGGRFFGYLQGGRCDDPVLAAVVHTVRSFGIDPADFRAFLRSMAMDLTVTSYAAYDDLLGYMDGSAAVIGTMMLPVLESADPARAREPARQLGLAFQLTNFIRDVGEDLRRGRIYLDQFGVTRADLARPEPTPAVRELLAFECARARAHYQAALPGVELLAPSSQPCIRAALELYGGILDELERRDYQVLRGRVRLSRRRRAAIFARHLTAAARAARRERQVDVSLPGS